MTDHDLLGQLRVAAGDLTYPSDADEPFDPFVWPATPGEAAAQVRARAGGRPVDVVPADAFFAELGEDARFVELRATLDRTLSGMSVVRVGGSTEVDLYLIGRATDLTWAGLHTVSVET